MKFDRKKLLDEVYVKIVELKAKQKTGDPEYTKAMKRYKQECLQDAEAFLAGVRAWAKNCDTEAVYPALHHRYAPHRNHSDYGSYITKLQLLARQLELCADDTITLREDRYEYRDLFSLLNL